VATLDGQKGAEALRQVQVRQLALEESDAAYSKVVISAAES